ncbi:hypothetical protein GGC47_003966 [Bosea sp. OAE752]|uniref:hypothetical protein n=1 Tax=Bosea sp. OAE752 TaxID=2663873 RepID=UPI003D227638
MSRTNNMVVGYHGCEASTGRKILAGDEMLLSEKQYDWLGKGVYFWENDPQRAKEWADEKVAKGHYTEPFVIGALIDLGNCLDLTLRENHDFLIVAYDGYYEDAKRTGKDILVNKDVADDKNADKLLRFLDCAVINYLHSTLGASGFDSVRGMFVEGDSVYAGAGFRQKTHTQIAVVKQTCIKEVFVPRVLARGSKR